VFALGFGVFYVAGLERNGAGYVAARKPSRV
jgi:hypothetical protein